MCVFCLCFLFVFVAVVAVLSCGLLNYYFIERMLRIWEMPTTKVLKCCKQSVKDDLIEGQKNRVPEEKQTLKT